MERAEKNWERLVRATLQRGQLRSHLPKIASSGLAGPVPASLQNTANIDAILKAADEIQDEDPNVARILCEHAYSLAQNLDPVSEGRGVLQFKTGLMSVIKQKRAKRDGGTIDRNQDIDRLQEFYKSYREKNKVDEFQEEEKKLQSGAFSGDLRELERRTVKMKRVHATLKVLGEVVEALTSMIPEELRRVMEADAAMTEEVPYNIIPLDAPAPTNAITTFPEVRAAVLALSSFRDLAKLPDDYPLPKMRGLDILDLLCYVFGFQKDNTSNQREHIIHLLSNAQVRLGIPDEAEPKVDEAAIQNVFNKSLENYVKWCEYLGIHPVWNNVESLQKEKKLLLVSLYYLIWGEAANVRFLPECICYIFHQMARELEEILRQQRVQPAKSCVVSDGVSFLQQVILPLYQTIAAVLLCVNNMMYCFLKVLYVLQVNFCV